MFKSKEIVDTKIEGCGLVSVSSPCTAHDQRRHMNRLQHGLQGRASELCAQQYLCGLPMTLYVGIIHIAHNREIRRLTGSELADDLNGALVDLKHDGALAQGVPLCESFQAAAGQVLPRKCVVQPAHATCTTYSSLTRGRRKTPHCTLQLHLPWQLRGLTLS